jgi:hypothetical protein
MLLATERRRKHVYSIFSYTVWTGAWARKLGAECIWSAILNYYKKFVTFSENWIYAQ